MPFTLQEIENISVGVLDQYIKGQPESQTIQEKPLLAALKGAQKTFGGGRGAIVGRVKADYTTAFMGFSEDDRVTYRNPANMKEFSYDWKELFAGISLTFTELKKAGIVVNDTNGENTSQASGAEQFQLANLLDDKMEDMDEGMARSHNEMMWRDGTQSTKIIAGVQSIVTDNPLVGTVGGIDGSANTWWRNRAFVGSNSSTQWTGPKVTASTTNQTLTKFLRKEVRQLFRYGGRPKLWLAGTGFIEKLEGEIHEKGTYTQEGFSSNKATDISMAVINMKGVGQIQYDPTLDDLGRTNFCYALDTRFLYPMVMAGEDMKQHNPARPADQLVLYRGVTWTGTVICNKRNAHAVYEAN